MIAHFYLMAESFSSNAQCSNIEIEEKIKRLAEDVQLMHQYKRTNILYANYDELYPQIFYSTYTLFDFICNGQDLKRKRIIDRDALNALQNIIQKAQKTDYTFNEVKDELIAWTDESNCHGIIAFHKIEGLDDSLQIIYGIDEWYKFRRYFLAQYPRNADFFIDECIKYFPKLYFHDRNRGSIRAILKDCPKKIIFHLAALNDKFNKCRKENAELNRTQVLEMFSITENLDETATLEGDASRKKDFTFDFTDDDGFVCKICCEPHLKLCYNDMDTSYSNNRRIYFHEGVAEIHQNKILIGHIGTHL